MKGRIGTSVGLDRKAMRAYYRAAADASRIKANKGKLRTALGRSTRIVVIRPQSSPNS
jgi:hypothetical protein